MDIFTSVCLAFACRACQLKLKLNKWQENCDAKDSPDNNIVVVNFWPQRLVGKYSTISHNNTSSAAETVEKTQERGDFCNMTFCLHPSKNSRNLWEY